MPNVVKTEYRFVRVAADGEGVVARMVADWHVDGWRVLSHAESHDGDSYTFLLQRTNEQAWSFRLPCGNPA